MNTLAKYLMTLTLLAIAEQTFAHGIPLVLNTTSGVPTSFTPTSEAPNLVFGAATPPGFSNIFLSRFAAATSTDAVLFPGGGPSYAVNDGFSATSGPWLPYTSATYTIVTPLLFSDGTGPAVRAAAGTHLDIANRFGGGASGHTGAVSGGVSITGTSDVLNGPGVSLIDSHELAHRLYLDAGSTQTYGAYGFAYTVTVNFSGGETLTSGPLVDIYQMRDTSIAGGLNFNSASAALQEAASRAIYAAAVPEPASIALAGIGFAALLACALRARRRMLPLALAAGQRLPTVTIDNRRRSP